MVQKNASCNLPPKDLSLSFHCEMQRIGQWRVSSDSNQDRRREGVNMCVHDVTSILLETVLPWKRVMRF